MAAMEKKLLALSNLAGEQTSTTIKAGRDDGDDTDLEQPLWFEYIMGPGVGMTEHPPPTAKICRVDPKILRDASNFEEHFHPRRISVGPYHHFKDDHQLERIKNLKPEWAKRYIEDSNQTIENLYDKIYSEISQLKRCYIDIDEFEDKHAFDYKYSYDCDCDTGLARMMVLDGCSVLCFIHYTMMGKLGALNIEYSTANYIMQDLFLLENQLPFRVLELLLPEEESSNKSIKVTIKRGIERLVSHMTNSEQGNKERAYQHQPFHLLDLLRTRLLGGTGTEAKKENYGGGGGRDSLYCRNVKGLKAGRIRIMPSKTNKLTDVSFISSGINGCLYLPPLTIGHSTVTLLWNLIAYEICANVTTDSGVTSYVTFLDSLIDYSEDVEELESAGVLQNSFGSSLEVARFFNSISSNLAARYVGFDPRVIAGIKAHVARHGTHRTYIWTSQLLDGYFSSPWKFIALVAAFLVIILTAVQTYFAVFPR